MRWVLTMLPFILPALLATAQSTFQGQVIDKSGEPIVGANVYLKGTYEGTSCDDRGYFSLTTEESGAQVLHISFTGYRTYEKEVVLDLERRKILLGIIYLQETINKLEAVTITAGRLDASGKHRSEVLNPLDIVTTAGATADIAGALNTLPGTQTVGEEGRLFVRGGSGEETKTFIDGMLVGNAYNSTVPNVPGRGRFSPFMFKGTSFSTGGYGAEYGQALSSALILDTKDKAIANRTDISLMSVGADISRTQQGERTSLAAKLQYTNLSPYFKAVQQNLDWRKAPRSIEGNAAFRQQVGEMGLWKVYGQFNHNSMTLEQKDIDRPTLIRPLQLENGYIYLNSTLKNSINENASYRTGISYTRDRNVMDIDGTETEQLAQFYHTKITFDHDLAEAVGLRWGVELLGRDHASRQGMETLNFEELIWAGHGTATWYLNNDLLLSAGLRITHNTLLRETQATPRISAAYKTGEDSQISLAYGQFKQAPESDLLHRQKVLQSPVATHYILSYQKNIKDRVLRVETYHKTYGDLVRFSSKEASGPLDNSGTGYARGVELFWRDNRSIERLDYWVSYSFLDTRREHLDFPELAIPTFASAHNASLVLKYFFNAWRTSIGTSFSYASPRRYHIQEQAGFHQGKTKSYQDLSLNISYLLNSQVILHTSINNVLGRQNVFGYEYGQERNAEGRLNRRAIGPAAPRFFFIGAFITLSKNKTLNQLPNL